MLVMIIGMIMFCLIGLILVEYWVAESDYKVKQVERKLEMCREARDICNQDCEHCAWRID